MYEFRKYVQEIAENQSKDIPDTGFSVDNVAKTMSINFGNNFDSDGPFTIVCSGAARGGSSILPFMFSHAGVPMGQFEADNYEDIEILRNRHSPERLLEIIGRRNEEHTRWGFKIPSLRRGQYGFFDANLRNPIFIFIFRNPLLTAQSVVQRANHPNFSPDRKGFGTALHGALQTYVDFTVFIKQTKSPCIMLSMEQLQYTPLECVSVTMDSLGLSVPEDLRRELAEQVQASGYKPRPEKIARMGAGHAA